MYIYISSHRIAYFNGLYEALEIYLYSPNMVLICWISDFMMVLTTHALRCAGALLCVNEPLQRTAAEQQFWSSRFSRLAPPCEAAGCVKFGREQFLQASGADWPCTLQLITAKNSAGIKAQWAAGLSWHCLLTASEGGDSVLQAPANIWPKNILLLHSP